MADAKISALPAATTPLTGSEVLAIVQSGSTEKVTVDNLTAGKNIPAKTFNSIYQKILTSTIDASSSKTLTIDFSGITGRMAQFQVCVEAEGYGAGALKLDVQGFLTNANYYSMVETGKYSYLAIVMGSATKGNNKLTVPVTNNHTGAANVYVLGIANMDFSISVA